MFAGEFENLLAEDIFFGSGIFLYTCVNIRAAAAVTHWVRAFARHVESWVFNSQQGQA